MKSNSSRFAYSFILILSVLILAFLTWFIYLKPEASTELAWVSYLPAVNAILNSLSTIFLLAGFYFIKKKNVKAHVFSMSFATATSGLFLVSYLLYHHFQGDTKFVAMGPIRYGYFAILISHVLLSMVQVPLIFITLWNAFTKRYEKHKFWARWTFPIWLYVSITGVVIFIFLKFLNN